MLNLKRKDKFNDQLPLQKKIHPGIKFFCFIIAIVFIFLANSLFTQIIFTSFLLIIYSLCKIKRKNFLIMIRTFIIMFILFTIINWFFYKNPIAFNTEGFTLIGNKNILDNFNWAIHENNIYVSQIWGGNIINQINEDMIKNFANENASTITSWCKNNNIDLSKIILPNGWNNLDDELKKAFVYMLNNNFEINGEKFKVLFINSINKHNGLHYEMKNMIWYQTNWYSLSPTMFVRSLYISLKIFGVLIASSMLTETTTSIELSSGLETIFSPLRIIKFPVNETATIIAIAIRFIPTLLSESKRILNAQAARGVDYNNGNVFIKMKSLVSLVVPLFSIAFKNADELANAMDARGYNPKAYRTKYRTFNFSYHDFILLTLVVFFGTLITCAHYLKLFFTFLGAAEGDLVF